jgi:hypothetical protein
LFVFLITHCRYAYDFSSALASVLLPCNLTATTSGVLLTKSLETAGLIEGFNDWKLLCKLPTSNHPPPPPHEA